MTDNRSNTEKALHRADDALARCGMELAAAVESIRVAIVEETALRESVKTIAAEYDNLSSGYLARTEKLQAEVARLRGVLEGLAERDCEYGDNCPTFGSKHGKCVGCIARAALKEE